MNEEEFLKELKNLPKSYKRERIEGSIELIRLTDETGLNYCPITAVAQQHAPGIFLPTQAVACAAQRLGLSPTLVSHIIRAADYSPRALGPEPQLLRRRIQKALRGRS